jgi:tRNA(adenine34) deaminase
MRLALEAARSEGRALGRIADSGSGSGTDSGSGSGTDSDADSCSEVPVGAVVIGPDGDVLATGTNIRERDHDPTGHAEVVALRAAGERLGGWRLDGCLLAVTLEPCTMCAGAIVLSRVSTLVFGAFDPKAGAVASLWDVVRDRRLNHRPAVVGGVLAEECGGLLRDFFGDRRL